MTIIISTVVASAAVAQKQLDKKVYYEAMQSESLGQIDAALDMVRKCGLPENEAFEGALLMKKAGLVDGLKDKMQLFRAGHGKLEKAIGSDAANTEYHFLRLMIQENAPKILGYNKDVEQDCEYIRTHFKNLSPVIQRALVSYSKKSKALGPLSL